jgi:hypothetical protein
MCRATGKERNSESGNDYVAGRMLDWLLIESDHNVFFVCVGKASTPTMAHQ